MVSILLVLLVTDMVSLELFHVFSDLIECCELCILLKNPKMYHLTSKLWEYFE